MALENPENPDVTGWFDLNYTIDVNDERYWAEVLAALERSEQARRDLMRREYQT